MPIDKYINICLNLKTNINIDTYMLPTAGESEVSGASEDIMASVLLHTGIELREIYCLSSSKT